MNEAVIDFIEAAYNLQASAEEWLPNLLDAGLPLLDDGLSVAGVVYTRPPHGGPITASRFHVAAGSDEFAERYVDALERLPDSVSRELLAPGRVETLSECAERFPGAWTYIQSQFDAEADGMNLTAVDPNGQGVHIFSALKQETKLKGRLRERWEMLAAHICAAHRLRRALHGGRRGALGKRPPKAAEAVIDPKDFSVADAAPAAEGSLSALRQAAIQSDRARGPLRSKPGKALEAWNALVAGRWSMADWFDSEGRRLVLAIPNAPGVTNPRGLTEREAQVAAYAALGHSNTLIAYELGVSRPRVTCLLGSAMKKLGARTQVHLMRKLHELGGLELLRENQQKDSQRSA